MQPRQTLLEHMLKYMIQTKTLKRTDPLRDVNKVKDSDFLDTYVNKSKMTT